MLPERNAEAERTSSTTSATNVRRDTTPADAPPTAIAKIGAVLTARRG